MLRAYGLSMTVTDSCRPTQALPQNGPNNSGTFFCILKCNRRWGNLKVFV